MSLRRCRDLRAVRLDPRKTLLIFDQRLLKRYGSWIRKFPFRYSVKSGESLKDLKFFPKHVEALLAHWPEAGAHEVCVAAFGGGSVGDFAGFFASVAKRGVRFVQIPSTWLAAIDSAHGGKTALNVKNAKNQIGSFHAAEQVFLVRKVLLDLPSERLQESFGEVFKIALLKGGALWRQLKSHPISPERVWRLLPKLIAAKMDIVKRDPRETLGIRSLLNFGHTLGHAFEAELKIPHGEAVALGLHFALNWSRQKGLLLSNQEGEIFAEQELFPTRTTYDKALRRLKKPLLWLKQDKKRAGGSKIRFIFLRRPGYPVILTVSMAEIDAEIRRQRRQVVSVSRFH